MEMRHLKQHVGVISFILVSAPSVAQAVLWDNRVAEGVGDAWSGARTLLQIEIRHAGRKSVGRTES